MFYIRKIKNSIQCVTEYNTLIFSEFTDNELYLNVKKSLNFHFAVKVFHGHISRQKMFTYKGADNERSNLHRVDSMGVRKQKKVWKIASIMFRDHIIFGILMRINLWNWPLILLERQLCRCVKWRHSKIRHYDYRW